MEGNKAKFYAGVITLTLIGVTLIVLCVLCKVCLASKKIMRGKLVQSVIGQNGNSRRPKRSRSYIKDTQNMLSEESQFMLSMHQGNYMGYEALEQDVAKNNMAEVTPTKELSSNSFTQPYLKIRKQLASEFPDRNEVSSNDDIIDMNSLKRNNITASRSSDAVLISPPPKTTEHDSEGTTTLITIEPEEHQVNKRAKGLRSKSRNLHSHSCTDYTIWEETSDLSGSEGILDLGQIEHQDDSSSFSDSDDTLEDTSEQFSDDTDTVRSLSSESFSSTINLLESLQDEFSLGRIEYSLMYDSEKQQVVLQIIQAKNLDLSLASGMGFHDCFIKAYLDDCSEQDIKKQSKLCKGTNDPVFKENFLFTVEESELRRATLVMQVFSRDAYARQRLVGEATVHLNLLASLTSYRTWSPVTDYDHQPASEYGQVQVHLTLLDNALKVQLHDLQLFTKPLVASHHQRHVRLSPCEPDMFLTCTLINDNGKPMLKQKTPSLSHHNLLTTERNHTAQDDQQMTFDINSYTQFLDYQLVIELCRKLESQPLYETLAYNVLGNGTTDTELAHWCYIYSKPQHSLSLKHSLFHLGQNAAKTREKYTAPLIISRS